MRKVSFSFYLVMQYWVSHHTVVLKTNKLYPNPDLLLQLTMVPEPDSQGKQTNYDVRETNWSFRTFHHCHPQHRHQCKTPRNHQRASILHNSKQVTSCHDFEQSFDLDQQTNTSYLITDYSYIYDVLVMLKYRRYEKETRCYYILKLISQFQLQQQKLW